MFSLNGAVKYKYIPNYRDMRGGYDKLCGVIRSLGEDPEDGTAYVFTSKDQKIVKIIRYEHNECQMYYQKFDKNMSFVRLEFEGVLLNLCVGVEVSSGYAFMPCCKKHRSNRAKML